MVSTWGNINHRLHETSLCFMLPTHVEVILMRWLHDPIYNETLPKSMKWTLITILSRNFKFDRHLSKAICMSANRRLTNRVCYGKRFLNVGGGGGGVIQESNYSFFKWRHCQRTLLVWKDFISNINLGQTNSLNLNKFGISNSVPDCLSALLTC